MNLTGFPRRTLREDQALHRIPGAARGPWWFSADGSGRFDPRGTGYGACYLAERPMGAWIEVFRKRLLLPEDEVTARVLLSVRLRRAVRLADVTSRRAPGYGATVSLGSGESYDASQRFATDAIAAGYEGVRYFVRHDPAQKLYGYALFAPAGAPEPDDPLWPAGDDGPIPRELIEEAARLSGYRVLPAP